MAGLGADIVRQRPDQVVDVTLWRKDEDFPVFPVGSKPKRLLIAPGDVDFPFLIPNHSYLFKTADNWQQFQVWSEIVAYQISLLVGVMAPPAFLAVDRRSGECGVLVEFFYRYPTRPSARLVHASDLMQRLLVDKKAGRPHPLRGNLMLCRALQVDTPELWWTKTLFFDALVGNTDRHPENWGFLVQRQIDARPVYRLTPAFDNATSLGYEFPEDALQRARDPNWLIGYIRRGTHHCGATLSDDVRIPHLESLDRLSAIYDQAAEELARILSFEDEDLDDILDQCVDFETDLRFTPARARFVSILTKQRKRMLRETIGERVE